MTPAFRALAALALLVLACGARAADVDAWTLLERGGQVVLIRHGLTTPGFGDPHARIVVVGLAPAAHGANRTGRMFTGDRSGDFLFAALHRTGFASRPTSVSRDDGMVLTGLRLTAPVHCAPPENRPTPAERRTCAPWLGRELEPVLRSRIAAGAIAVFESPVHERESAPRPDLDLLALLRSLSGGRRLPDEPDPELRIRMRWTIDHELPERASRPSDAADLDALALAVTHCDLTRSLRGERSRDDLLYRVPRIVPTVPLLRERPEDVPLPTGHFRRQVNRRHCLVIERRDDRQGPTA